MTDFFRTAVFLADLATGQRTMVVDELLAELTLAAAVSVSVVTERGWVTALIVGPINTLARGHGRGGLTVCVSGAEVLVA